MSTTWTRDSLRTAIVRGFQNADFRAELTRLIDTDEIDIQGQPRNFVLDGAGKGDINKIVGQAFDDLGSNSLTMDQIKDAIGSRVGNRTSLPVQRVLNVMEETGAITARTPGRTAARTGPAVDAVVERLQGRIMNDIPINALGESVKSVAKEIGGGGLLNGIKSFFAPAAKVASVALPIVGGLAAGAEASEKGYEAVVSDEIGLGTKFAVSAGLTAYTALETVDPTIAGSQIITDAVFDTIEYFDPNAAEFRPDLMIPEGGTMDRSQFASFDAVYDGLPLEATEDMPPEVASLVEAKSFITQAEAQMSELTAPGSDIGQKAAAAAQLTTAQEMFSEQYDALAASGQLADVQDYLQNNAADAPTMVAENDPAAPASTGPTTTLPGLGKA